MRDLISSLVVASALTFSANAFGGEYKVGDEMPEEGKKISKDFPCHNSPLMGNSSFAFYDSGDSEIKHAIISLDPKGKVLVVYDGRRGRVYADADGNNKIESSYAYAANDRKLEIGPTVICPNFKF